MKNYVYSGSTIEVTAPYAVVSGAGVLVGAIFGIAADDSAISVTMEIKTEGVFDLAKDTSVFSQGDRVFWDNTAKLATSVAAGNRSIGRAVQAQLTGDATVRLMLNQASSGVPMFISTEQTGTGSSQNIPHGLGSTPSAVFVAPTDLTPSTVGSYVIMEGVHDATNVKVTVTTSKKFKVIAVP